MMIVWASPDLAFTYVKPSAPAPPALFTTTSGRGDSLYLSTIGAINRAIWSAPPPVPAGTTNSMGLVGSHASTKLVRPPSRPSPSRATTISTDRRAMAPPPHLGLHRRRDGKGAASRLAAPSFSTTTTAMSSSPVVHDQVGIGISAGALRNETTPGMSQFSHISSTLAWK